jgi:hypothetical protein
MTLFEQLYGAALAVLIPLTGWAGKTLIQHKEDIAVLKAELSGIARGQQEIKEAIERQAATCREVLMKGGHR